MNIFIRIYYLRVKYEIIIYDNNRGMRMYFIYVNKFN